MDITKTKNHISYNTYFNAQSVNYTVSYLIGFIAFLILKQIFKLAFGISAGVSIVVSFAIVMLGMYFAESKLVFVSNTRTGRTQQILRTIFRIAVDAGFFLLLKFSLCEMLGLNYTLPYFIAAVLIYFFNFYFDRLIVFDSVANPSDNSSSKIYRYIFSNRYVFLSCVLTTICILFVFAIFKLFPFGDVTVLRMDLYHQYGPLFVELYDRITGFESFLYSWRSGGGSSFLGNYFNYLSSPLSMLIFLFNKNQIGYAITTLVLVKGALCAGTFSYYLKNSQGSHSIASACFGVFYALSGYFLAYYWNVMWLDGMMLLPIIALGIENIINKKNCCVYVLSLALLLYSNYYMGYMACIFSVIYFLLYFCACYEITDNIGIKAKKESFITKLYSNRFINTGISFALSSLLVGAICAFFLIPVYFILQACSATSDNFPNEFKSYFDLLNMLGQHLAGLETTIRSSGDDVLPNIYCGILPVLLIPLYLINDKISIKEKFSYVLALVFFIISFNNNIANFLWHALHMPNDLPYRFSYMYSFIFLVIAFKGLKNLHGIKYRDIMLTGIGALLVILILQKFPTNKISEYSIYVSIAFVMVWTLVLLLIKKEKLSKFVIGVTILCMTFSECIVADSSSYVFTQKQADYVENMPSYTKAVEFIKENDEDLFRTELSKLNTRLDPCIYGYDGISTFSSMAYEKYSNTQSALGMYSNKINSYTYNIQTPVYNMMYNMKYLIKAQGSNDLSGNYFTLINTVEDNKKTEIYENDYFLPLAFTASSDLDMWITGDKNPFEVQESLIDNAAGVSNVFVPVEYVSTVSNGAKCDNITNNGTFTINAPENNEGGTVEITIKSVLDSNMYVYIKSPSITNVEYSRNDNDTTSHQSCDESYIYDLGEFRAGEEAKITLDTGGLTNGGTVLRIYAYNIDKDVLDSAYELLRQGGLNITNYSDTYIQGEINAGFDGYLYTSIPYDEGWKIYIDGVEAESFALADSQLCCEIEAGVHSVKMKYTPKGIYIGTGISAISVLLLGIIWVIKNKNRIKPDFV